jgi:hypothetical protein
VSRIVGGSAGGGSWTVGGEERKNAAAVDLPRIKRERAVRHVAANPLLVQLHSSAFSPPFALSLTSPLFPRPHIRPSPLRMAAAAWPCSRRPWSAILGLGLATALFVVTSSSPSHSSPHASIHIHSDNNYHAKAASLPHPFLSNDASCICLDQHNDDLTCPAQPHCYSSSIVSLPSESINLTLTNKMCSKSCILFLLS